MMTEVWGCLIECIEKDINPMARVHCESEEATNKTEAQILRGNKSEIPFSMEHKFSRWLCKLYIVEVPIPDQDPIDNL